MRFTQSVFALAALTSTAMAQVAGFDAITNPSAADQTLTPGSSFDIIWQANTFTADTDTVSIILLAGETMGTLQPGTTPIASNIKNSAGKFTWTVPSSTATTYGFKIVLDANPATFQYSFPFHISGGTSSSSSSATGSSSVSSSASASVTAASTNTTTAASSSITAASGNTTSVKTDILTSTVCTVCLGSNATTSASTLAPVVTPSSNVTLATTIGATKTSAAGGASSAPASSSGTAKPSGNAAVSNAAQGGLALIGGLVIAFAL